MGKKKRKQKFQIPITKEGIQNDSSTLIPLPSTTANLAKLGSQNVSLRMRSRSRKVSLTGNFVPYGIFFCFIFYS